MTEQSVFSIYRYFSLILICTLLGACATTQRSSSGAGDQAVEPATQTSAAPQVATNPSDSSAATSSGADTSSNSAPTAVTSTNTDENADQAMPRSSASDEAAQLKSQLAEQAAEISALREEQKAEAERIEMAEQQKAAQAETQQAEAQQAAAASAAASPVVATRPDDKIAVFPQDANAGARAGASQPGQQSPVANSIERSVYFAFDQAKVDRKYDDMLMANANYLKSHSEVKAEVQGNCDERGSREYNLALGARRAHAVKRALEVAGADTSRIVAVSFGSEKPVAPGKDEASYSRNRRADIVY